MTEKPAKKPDKQKRTLKEIREARNSKHMVERVKAEALAKELTPDPSKLLSPDGKMVLSEPELDESLRDPFADRADLLKTEWAFYGGELEPEIWLETVKGYDRRQSKKIVSFEGYSAWKDKRLKFQNQALENFTMRSVDTLVEFQDYIAKGAKLTLVRAMEMLQTPVKKIDPTTGKWMPGLTSMDVKNIGETLDKAQTTMMRALGIHPKEEVGIKIVYEQLKTIQMSHGKDATAGAKTYDESGEEIKIEGPVDDPRMHTLSNEEIWGLVEILREQRKKESENEG